MAYIVKKEKTVEGTAFSIENVVSLKSLELYGDIKQQTYTGKNLLQGYASASQTKNGITLEWDAGTQIITINGTCNTDNTTFNFVSHILEAGTYSLSYKIVSGSITPTSRNMIQILRTSDWSGISVNLINANNKYENANLSASTYNYCGIRIDNGTVCNNFKIKVQLEKNSTATDWEPYVGGIASPNPEYPQKVQTVTGRQALNFVGKNLFIPTLTNNGIDISQVYCTATLNGDEYLLTATGADMRIGTVRNANLSYEDILGTLYPVNNAERIYLYLTNEIFNKNFITWYDENKVSLGYVAISSPNSSAGVPSNAKYFSIRFGYGNAVSGTTYSTKVMVSYTPITEYEPYIGKQYEINLGKNLFNKNDIVAGYLSNAGNVISNTQYSSSYFINIKNVKTVTISGSSGNSENICFYDSSQTFISFISTGTNATLTTSVPSTAYYCRITVKNTNLDLVQFEKGSQATSYSAYKEPIELCKINDYQDYIAKSTGKNLFGNYTIINGWISGTTMRVNSINGNRMAFIPCQPNTTYTISRSVITSTFRVCDYTEIPTMTSSNVDYTIPTAVENNNGTSITYTTSANAKYLIVHYGLLEDTNLQQSLESIMVENGSQATQYEPYGKVWYIHKEIGKVALNGSENWNVLSSEFGKRFYLRLDNALQSDTTSGVKSYCSHFTLGVAGATWTYKNCYTISGTSDIIISLDENYNTANDFKNWLNTHNTDVYYPLANPEIIEITNIELINQLNSIELLEGLNNVNISSDDLIADMSMNYYERINEYYNTIYSGDARHKIRIWFNDVELEDADRYCEKLTRQARIIPNDGSKRFTIDNFMAQELELVLHRIDTSIIQDQVRIELGTLIDEENETYAYVPLGIFNIQDNPTTDKDKITIKLRDNRVKFDFAYNAQPLIEENGGTATKLQILNDICSQAGVINTVTGFTGQNDEIGIYDNTITATMYIAYIASQAGAIAIINRYGELEFIYLNELKKVKVPLYLVEKYELGTQYSIERVVYEDGIRKFQTSDDENLSTLYIGSDNPYISSQEQIKTISSKLIGFNIDSCTTGKIMGDPSIDAYDILEIYGYYNTLPNGNKEFVDDEDTVVFRTLANHTMTYTGKIISVYDTQIGKEARTENVSLNGEARFQRYAKSSIDNINNNIDLIVGEQTEQSERIANLRIDINSIQNLFQITGGTNLIKNSQFLLTDEVWNITVDNNGYCTELGQGYNANLIGRTTAIANIVMKDATITTKENNIVGLKVGQQYTLNYYYTLDNNATATVTLTGANSGNTIFTKTYNTSQSNLEREIVTFTANETSYILSITTSTTLDGYFTIYDLMLNSGDIKNWEPSISEVYSTVLKMSQLGLQVYAIGSQTVTLLTSMGFAIYTSSNGEIGQLVTNFTNSGIETIDIIASGKIKNGKWIQKDITINSYNHHIEYMESD